MSSTEEKSKPEGCTCDPRDWSAKIIPAACDSFVPFRGYCSRCFHGEECHKEKNSK